MAVVLKYILFLSIFFLITGCTKTPLALIEKRYKNLEEKRTIELIYKSENMVIYQGHKIDAKCKEVETIAVTNVNIEAEWEIYRAQNNIYCDPPRKVE